MKNEMPQSKATLTLVKVPCIQCRRFFNHLDTIWYTLAGNPVCVNCRAYHQLSNVISKAHCNE